MDITIDNLNSHYLIALTETTDNTIQQRLDAIARKQLSQVWGGVLTPNETGPSNDSPIYFIDDVNVDLTLDLAKDDRTLATDWSRALTQGILKAMQQSGGNLVSFPSRSEFMASFLKELLHGQAWSQWYYQEFEPLKSQPLNQSIVAVLTADGDVGRDALLILAQQGFLETLLAALRNEDVEILLRQCLVPPSPRVVLPNTYRMWVQALNEYLAASRWTPTNTNNVARNVVWLYFSLLKRQPQLGPDVNLARFLQEFLSWHQGLVTTQSLPQTLAWLTAEEMAAIWRQASPNSWLMPLVREVGGRQVAELLSRLSTSTSTPAVTQVYLTAYGGLFFLIPTLLELDLSDYLQTCAYPTPENGEKVGWLLYAIALQCLGIDHLEAALEDPALAPFVGVSTAPSIEALATYGNSLEPELHNTWQQTFQHHLEQLCQDPYRAALLQGLSAIPLEHRAQIGLVKESSNRLNLNPDWDDALATVSAAILHTFAAQLGAFAGSSPDYLRRNVLVSQARIEQRSTELRVILLTCPLQMVLRMVGLDSRSWPVPWWGDLPLTFEFE